MDLILNANNSPTLSEISEYIQLPGRNLWENLNELLQKRYNSAPKISFSKCSGKPGWNVKYQKSGKSLCTLYPEKDSFIALIVIRLDLIPAIEGSLDPFDAGILETIKTSKPFNGTLWLMIRVENEVILQDVKKLLDLKYDRKQ